MAVPLTVSGKVGRGLIGIIPIWLSAWVVDDDADDLDGTTAESDGYGDADIGVEQISGSIDGKYKIGVTKIAHLAPQLGTNLKLYTYKLLADTGPFWDIPSYAINGLRHGSQVRGEITFTCRFKSKGLFTRPVDPV